LYVRLLLLVFRGHLARNDVLRSRPPRLVDLLERTCPARDGLVQPTPNALGLGDQVGESDEKTAELSTHFVLYVLDAPSFADASRA